MTTARVTSELIKGGLLGAAGGSTSAAIGTIAMKCLGFLKNVPYEAIIKPSAVGGGVFLAALYGTMGYFSESFKPTKLTAEIMTENNPVIQNREINHFKSGALFGTLLVTGMELASYGALRLTGFQEEVPLTQLAFTLMIGNMASLINLNFALEETRSEKSFKK